MGKIGGNYPLEPSHLLLFLNIKPCTEPLHSFSVPFQPSLTLLSRLLTAVLSPELVFSSDPTWVQPASPPTSVTQERAWLTWHWRCVHILHTMGSREHVKLRGRLVEFSLILCHGTTQIMLLNTS